MKVIKMGHAIEPYCEKECPKCHAVIGIDGTDFDRMHRDGVKEIYCPVCDVLMGDTSWEFKKWWEDGLDWCDLRNKGLKEE